MAFITEAWLRQNFALEHGSTISVPEGAKLTPSAHGLLEERRITVNHVDADGTVVGVIYPAGKGPVAPTEEAGQENTCPQGKNSANDTARVLFRCKLDVLLAHTALVLEEFSRDSYFPDLLGLLGNVQTALAGVCKAEMSGDTMAPVVIGSLSSDMIKALARNPQEHLGIDNFPPTAGRGLYVAKLHLLRAELRETTALSGSGQGVARQDVADALEVLACAVQVLVLLTYLAEQGKAIALERIHI